MNSINNIYQYNSKKVFKILIALFILLFVSYISIFKGIADINLKRVLVTIFKNLSFNNTEPLSPREIVVFLDLRLARVVLGSVAGFLLAICGTVMQAITEIKCPVHSLPEYLVQLLWEQHCQYYFLLENISILI